MIRYIIGLPECKSGHAAHVVIPLLRPTKLRYYVTAMEKRGYAASAVLAGSGVSQARLKDPALLVDARQYEIVIGNMIRLTGNPALGLELGANVKLTDFGILAHAMMSSATLRQAVMLWVRFYNLVGMTIQLRLGEERRNRWTMLIDTQGMEGMVRQFCVEEIVMTANRLGAALCNQPYQPERCFFDYPAPGHVARYAEFLSCPIEFDAPYSGMVTRSPSLNAPLDGHDPEFNEICLRHCGQIMRQLSNSSPVVAQVRSLLLSRKGRIPDLEQTAEALGISARSIRRHLQREGTSYQKLVDAFRLELAKEYLRAEQLTPKEIGYQLGYSDISAFRRAFKSWTGMTLQQFVATSA